MFRVLNSKKQHEQTHSWQPSATIETLQLRAQILKSIRDFFNARGVMEVETPLLCHASVTDPYIQSIPAYVQSHRGKKAECYYLQTSPEYAMKRLLAVGSGPIFQITKAFRQEEVGRYHNPEFTMLEWYRPGFDHHALMNETDELLQVVLKTSPAERKSYAALFQTHLGIDPHQATLSELMDCAKKNNISVAGELSGRDAWLQLLMSEVIEPKIGQQTPCFIYDYPASQAALARIQPTIPPVASRFEVYYKGIELANAFHELQNADEQRKRFEKNLEDRQALNLESLPIDELFLSALEHGLPDCAGIALGMDRLVMLAAQADNLASMLAFDFSRA